MDKKKLGATGKSSGQGKAEQASTVAKDAPVRRRVDMKMVQNVLLIWLDSNIDDNNQDCQSTATQLRRVVNDVNTFTDGDECIRFIEDIDNNKVCMIVSGSLGHPCKYFFNKNASEVRFVACESQQWNAKNASNLKHFLRLDAVENQIAARCG